MGMEAAYTYGTYMSTTLFDSEFATEPASRFSWAKAIFVEPLLTLAVAAFWLVTLPFVAVSLVCVKIGDALVAMESASEVRLNPLFLRSSSRRAPEVALTLRNREAVRAGHA